MKTQTTTTEARPTRRKRPAKPKTVEPPARSRHRDQKSCLRSRYLAFGGHASKLESALRYVLRRTLASLNTREVEIEDIRFKQGPTHYRSGDDLSDFGKPSAIMNGQTPNKALLLWHTRDQMEVYDHRCASQVQLWNNFQ